MPDENAIQTVLQRVYFASSSPVLNTIGKSDPVLTIKVQVRTSINAPLRCAS
jgi:hypothetical protein